MLLNIVFTNEGYILNVKISIAPDDSCEAFV